MKILLRRTLSVTPLRNLPVNKRLRKFGQSIYCKIFIYVLKYLFASLTSHLLEKLALIFLHNFHREHRFLKLKIKKVIAENQCEKHKKSSLVGRGDGLLSFILHVGLEACELHFCTISFNDNIISVLRIVCTLTFHYSFPWTPSMSCIALKITR